MKILKKLAKINLLKTSIIISLIGIFLLLFLTNILNPKQININQINNKLLNKNVQVQGQVLNIKTYENQNLQVILIKDETSQIEIITNKITNLENNETIIVIGKITTYKEDLQITADKIILIT